MNLFIYLKSQSSTDNAAMPQIPKSSGKPRAYSPDSSGENLLITEQKQIFTGQIFAKKSRDKFKF